MPTERQSESARINGAKSHGPKSAEGKKKSSRNSLRHGCTASHTIILRLREQRPSEPAPPGPPPAPAPTPDLAQPPDPPEVCAQPTPATPPRDERTPAPDGAGDPAGDSSFERPCLPHVGQASEEAGLPPRLAAPPPL